MRYFVIFNVSVYPLTTIQFPNKVRHKKPFRSSIKLVIITTFVSMIHAITLK